MYGKLRLLTCTNCAPNQIIPNIIKLLPLLSIQNGGITAINSIFCRIRTSADIEFSSIVYLYQGKRKYILTIVLGYF